MSVQQLKLYQTFEIQHTASVPKLVSLTSASTWTSGLCPTKSTNTSRLMLTGETQETAHRTQLLQRHESANSTSDDSMASSKGGWGGWPGGRAKSGHQAYRRARFQLERGGADTVGARSEKSERAPPTNHWYATPSLLPARAEAKTTRSMRRVRERRIGSRLERSRPSQLSFLR